MKSNWNRWGLLLLAFAVAPVAWLNLNHAAEPGAPPASGEVAALRTEVERLKAIVPDQSHAMADVGYHFANLWFAGNKKNWPLAKFYLDETGLQYMEFFLVTLLCLCGLLGIGNYLLI